MHEIWFWQQMLTPHMAGLAIAVAEMGKDVTFVAQHSLAAERIEQGWKAPHMPGVNVLMASDHRRIREVVREAPSGSLHICEGIRGNGLVSSAQSMLGHRRLRQWVVMETVNDHGWRGLLKRAEYRRLFYARRDRWEAVLAIGSQTTCWVTSRGVPRNKVFPFAYSVPGDQATIDDVSPGPYRILFVGRLITLKRLDLLIEALARLDREDVVLTVVGSGPKESELYAQASRQLAGRFQWVGRVPQDQVRREMANADLLVLPSEYDGWGVVANEALMSGTPVLMSDACGASDLVRESWRGGVFRSASISSLVDEVERAIQPGPLSAKRRKQIQAWAQESISPRVAARYILDINNHLDGRAPSPVAPWLR